MALCSILIVRGQSHDETRCHYLVSPPDMRALFYMNSVFHAIDHNISYK